MAHPSLDSWLSYIESQHPAEIELGLDRGLAVLQRLDLSRPKHKVITVAGTNGKGSTCTLISSYLVRQGYRVGTYTSPHFLRFNERVALDSQPCSDSLLMEAFAVVEQARGDIPLTYFEFSTLAGLWVFSQQSLDYWVLEVGLGGRLDSVNMIDTDVAVITSIALDHMDWLGDSIEVIGREKAGICRPGKPLVNGMYQGPASIAQVAAEQNAIYSEKGVDFRTEVTASGMEFHGFDQHLVGLPLPKLPQENVATVIAALIQAEVEIDHGILSQTLADTTLTGRFQQVANDPVIYLDVAHNPEAAGTLVQQLQGLERQPIAICGMLKDKDIASVMALLKNSFASWHLLDLDVPRGSKADHLKQYLPAAQTHQYSSMAEALAVASDEARKEQRAIVVFGSFITVTEYLSLN